MIRFSLSLDAQQTSNSVLLLSSSSGQQHTCIPVRITEQNDHHITTKLMLAELTPQYKQKNLQKTVTPTYYSLSSWLQVNLDAHTASLDCLSITLNLEAYQTYWKHLCPYETRCINGSALFTAICTLTGSPPPCVCWCIAVTWHVCWELIREITCYLQECVLHCRVVVGVSCGTDKTRPSS